MDRARWQKICNLFEDARSLPPDARSDFIDEACKEDSNLKEEVESLLSHHDAANGILDTPALGTEEDVSLVGSLEGDGTDEQPFKIGRYALEREIGRGGMGVVWEAVQEKPRRRVALKVMKSGVVSSEAIKRFWYETEILGRLTHPNVAQIYEAAIHHSTGGFGGDSEVPYFPMEFVPDAKTIIEYARSGDLEIEQCLKIFVDVCDAVHSGHQKAVIHRDLKPANILVDSSGSPKIIDFGVARTTNADMTMTTIQTSAGQLVGTVQYMSPEQCDADPDKIDIRTDVYSLGVVLYELLCGQTPYDASSSSIYHATRIIKESAPVPLSRVNLRFRGDLETIVTKALEKDRERRYQSAGDLGADIQRYLDGRPVEARKPSLAYHAAILARQHKAAVVGAAAVFVCLIAVTIVTLIAKAEVEKERDAVEKEKDRAEARLFLARMSAVDSAILQNDLRSAGALLESFPTEQKGWEWHHRNARLQDDSMRESISPFEDKPNDQLHHVEWSPDGRWILAGGEYDRYFLYDRPSRNKMDLTRDVPLIKGETNNREVTGVAFRPGCRSDCSGFALAFNDGPLWIESFRKPSGQSGRFVDDIGISTGPLLFGKRGEWLYVGSIKPPFLIRAINTKSNNHYSLTGHTKTVKALALSSDGTRLASGSHDHSIILWNIENPELATKIAVLKGHRGSVLSLDFTHKQPSQYLISGSIDGDVRIWDVPASEKDARDRGGDTSGILAAVLEKQDSWINAVAACPTGRFLAFAGGDRVVRIWRMAPDDGKLHDQKTKHRAGAQLELEEVSVLRGHHSQIRDLDFSPDGKEVVSISDDGTVKIWATVGPGSVPSLAGHESRVNQAIFTDDGQYLASVGGDFYAMIWEVESCKNTKILTHTLKDVKDIAFCDEDRFLVTASAAIDSDCPEERAPFEGALCVWDWRQGDVIYEEKMDNKVLAVDAFDPERWIAAGLEDGQVVLWTLSPRGGLGHSERFNPHSHAVTTIAFSPDGRWLATGSKDKMVQIKDLETGISSTLKIYSEVRDIAFCTHEWRSNHWLAIASNDGSVALWDAARGEELKKFPETHTQEAMSVAFSPDGSRLASGAFDGSVKLWDPIGGECVLTFRSHVLQLYSVAWAPNPSSKESLRLCSTGSGHHGRDNTIKLWETELPDAWRESRIKTHRDEIGCR